MISTISTFIKSGSYFKTTNVNVFVKRIYRCIESTFKFGNSSLFYKASQYIE